jgi:hypothetical protein
MLVRDVPDGLSVTTMSPSIPERAFQWAVQPPSIDSDVPVIDADAGP